MANLFSTMGNRIGQAIGGWLSPFIGGGLNNSYDMPAEDLARRYATLRNYYNGDHKQNLKSQDGAQNDNVTQNWIGNLEDKAIARMFRGGVQFNLPDGATAQQEYINRVWDINKKEIILFQYRLHGGVYGTPYFKVCPDEMIDPYTDKIYPRLVALDPEIVRINPSQEDVSEVESYVIEYSTKHKDASGKISEVGHREITRHAKDGEEYEKEDKTVEILTSDSWVVEEYELSVLYGNKWTLVSTTPWEYNFPPIIHQKNLPSLRSCYGDSDFDDVINVQDRNNFVISNTSKIVKFFANPITFIFGTSAKTMKENKLDSPVGALYAIPDKDAKAMNLEMSSDLSSSRDLSQDLKAAVYEISREVSTDSIGDKLGQLTNFGLRVLYTDALDKTDTQRQLYGDALKELNRRLLVLANFTGEQSNPGKITWGEALINNVVEDLTADEKALGMGIIDKETITKRYQSRYGVSYEDVQKKLADEKKEANANNSNIGAEILRRFNQGQGAEAQNVNGNNGNRPIPIS
jgi:hypothetical protein